MDKNNSEGWDWPWLYYVGTVILRMSESQFWKCTPRKLKALSDVYVEHKGGVKSSDTDKYAYSSSGKHVKGYIDDVL